MNGLKNTGRRQAQREYQQLKCCARCGIDSGLQRHHCDRNPTNNSDENIEILCQTCHKEEHLKDGTWGKGKVEPGACVICAKEIPRKRNRRGRVCSPECLSQLGAISAAKRWQSRTAWTALEPLEMGKFRLWQQRHSPRSQPSSIDEAA